jgi:hypothetical protein
MEIRNERIAGRARAILGHGVPSGPLRAVGARGRATGAASGPGAPPARLGGDRADAAGEDAASSEHPASDTVATAAPASANAPCPACELAADLAQLDAVGAFCAGVVRGLEAVAAGGVTLVFQFCPDHRGAVRRATQRAAERKGQS